MRISIVTPSLNQREFLARTADSILSQKFDGELEWIVSDGQSRDGTLDLLRSISDSRLRWISEPDQGQADAVNKGLQLASGDVAGWLNSDDLYLPGALRAVRDSFSTSPASQWLIGRCQIIDNNDRVIRRSVTRYKDRGLRKFSYRRLLRENFVSQPAVFWRREFGREAGPLDSSLHWAMDYDLWLRMAQRADPIILDQVVAQFRLHPRSKSGLVDRGQFDEEYRVCLRHIEGDWVSRLIHRFNVEKIVWAYRAMALLGR